MYVRVPKEIKEYEEKLFAGLTFRQLVWGIIAIICALLTYFFGRNIISTQILSYVVILVATPLFIIGWVKFDGLPADKYFKIILSFYSKKQLLEYDNLNNRKEMGISGKNKKKAIQQLERVQEETN